MDYRQLDMFQAVLTLGSITEAARHLGVTQPAVSLAMRKLERDVGFPLFRRDGRRLVPTAEARHLSSEAFRVLADFRHLTETAAGISAAQSGTLTIATNPSPAIAWLPTIAAAFRRERPQVRLRLLTRSSEDVRLPVGVVRLRLRPRRSAVHPSRDAAAPLQLRPGGGVAAGAPACSTCGADTETARG